MRGVSRAFAAVALVMLVAAVPLAAQQQAPIKVSLGAGLTVPQGDFNDGFKMGWGALGAVSYQPPALPVGFRVDLSMAQVRDETPLDLKSEMFYGTGNILYEVEIRDVVLRPYLLGGGGVYWFNPRGEDAAGIESDTRFGLNVGAGLEVKPGRAGIFVESRLHHVFVPDDDTQFAAIVAGVRLGPF